MPTTLNFVERIHASGHPLVLAVTGGGSGAISALLQVPGASATVLEAVVPYAATALQQWLGGKPDQYCSERTARAMAMAAFERARKLVAAGGSPAAGSTGVTPVATRLRGIGATASLASTRPKRGAHRIHAAWQSADTTVATSCEMPSNSSRAEEEQFATELILDAVGEACGIENSTSNGATRGSIERREQHAPKEWAELLLGQRSSVTVGNNSDAAAPNILFPGAFNPIHSGHMRMAKLAAEKFGGPVAFELSIVNVDKPPLDFVEIADRLSQLHGQNVLLTRAPTFVEKAQLAPGCVFVVGIDTLMRIGEPAYYGGDAARRDAAIQTIADCKCRFLVFGRVAGASFQSLKDFQLRPELRALCDEVPESMFREDVSSTELRGRG